MKKGYSQEAFADYCGVHRTFMGTIERGETNLSFKNLAKLSAALGITLSQLLSGVERIANKSTGPSLLGTTGAQKCYHRIDNLAERFRL
jgi:transcriptional regulator with XRE-family HTH domain